MGKTEEILTFCRDVYTIACVGFCFRPGVYTNGKRELFSRGYSCT